MDLIWICIWTMYKEKYFQDKEILTTTRIFDDFKKLLPLICKWYDSVVLRKKILFSSYACWNTYGKYHVTNIWIWFKIIWGGTVDKKQSRFELIII